MVSPPAIIPVPSLDFEEMATRFQTLPAIQSPSGSITYQQLPTYLTRYRHWLLERGVKEGDRVVMVGENSPRQLLLMAALWQMAAVAVPINYHLPSTKWRQLARELSCKLVLVDPARIESDSRLNIQGMPNFIDTGDTPQDAELNPMDTSVPATIIFTTGSTGSPRAAVHSLANHLYSALGSAENIPLDPGDKWLLLLPLFHVGGLAIWIRCLLAGATVVIPASSGPQSLRPSDQVTHLSLVATQLRRLLKETAAKPLLAGLKAILVGGSAIPRDLLAQSHLLKLPLFTSYGSTEMSSQITATGPGDDLEDWLTAGRLLPHRELRFSETGEILLRGRTRFLGYWENGVLQDPGDPDGWIHTGDRGTLNTKDQLIVRGRVDNLFISGGENIQPEAIEHQLRDIAGIEDALVVPVPDSEYGFRPVAFIKSASVIDPEHLRRELRQNLSGIHVPRLFLLWPDHPPKVGIKLDRAGFQKLASSSMADLS